VLEHRAAFVNALRISGDEIRRRIFDTIEQHHAHDFANGRAGIELYEELLCALRDSGTPEVMKEFERRFFPLLSPSPAHSNAGPREEMTDQGQDVTRWRPLRTAVDQLVAKARSSLEPINAAIARVRAVASEITTAVRDRPRRDWRSTSIPYVAAFSSIAMLGVFVICTSFVSSPDVLAQAVNGGSPAGARLRRSVRRRQRVSCYSRTRIRKRSDRRLRRQMSRRVGVRGSPWSKPSCRKSIARFQA